MARADPRLTLELFTRRMPGLRIDEDRPPPLMLPTLIHRSPEALYLVVHVRPGRSRAPRSGPRAVAT
ncbi:hypothetical protein [Streptomyces sp. NPDC096193]|uniref:hypothetical protein n=1 Tax=Streptomyces sp. NPDC096193 TaxID=3155821 RepID=UPI00331C5485